MLRSALRTVRVPLRYADGSRPAGLFFALSHRESTCSFQSHDMDIIDGRTVSTASLLPVPIHDRPGEPTPFVGVNLKHDPEQRWYYFPDMQPDEALVFTLVDSDSSRVQRAAHTAFDDPSSRDGAAPRASYEVRTVAFFDE